MHSSQSTAGMSGWQCGVCKVWVPLNTTHYCASTGGVGVPPSGPAPGRPCPRCGGKGIVP